MAPSTKGRQKKAAAPKAPVIKGTEENIRKLKKELEEKRRIEEELSARTLELYDQREEAEDKLAEMPDWVRTMEAEIKKKEKAAERKEEKLKNGWVEKKKIRCEICNIVYGNGKAAPKILKCGHTLCFDCLKKITGQNSMCPFDNTPLSQSDALNCPTNHYIVQYNKE